MPGNLHLIYSLSHLIAYLIVQQTPEQTPNGIDKHTENADGRQEAVVRDESPAKAFVGSLEGAHGERVEEVGQPKAAELLVMR